ncbi:hypothetical protein MHBO_000183 [Bonamia ostreae]|uniref:Uncharacterized protein n=1 Tax=Bonamia ostreae TaxID=126728 RepID=A0ABV2AEP1_9EUKA
MGYYKYKQIKSDLLNKKGIEEYWPNENVGDNYSGIFIGDNIDGDTVTGIKLLMDGLVDFVFIHAVVVDQPLNFPHPQIFYFRDYKEAADLAFDHNLINLNTHSKIYEEYDKEYADYNNIEKIINMDESEY